MDSIERNLGRQPIEQIMLENNLKPHDLVIVSSEPITHKMVSKACKGRRLSPHVQLKILKALNKATAKEFQLHDLFNY